MCWGIVGSIPQTFTPSWMKIRSIEWRFRGQEVKHDQY